MTLVSERQKLVASNIANADTPGYHTKDIDFRSEFENAASGQPASVIEAGADSVAVISDLLREPRKSAEEFFRILR